MSKFVQLWKDESWNKFDEKDVQSFKGTVVHSKSSNNGISQRSNAYQLKTKNGNIDLYS